LSFYDYQILGEEIIISKEIINEKIELDLNSAEDL
jgi:hypothetical protein